MSEAQAETPAAPPAKSKKLLWIVLCLVLAAGGVGGFWFVKGRTHDEAPAAAKPQPALYYKLDPPFVVNFEAEQLVRFLQVTVEIMSRDPQAIDFLKQHDPVVRNDLLMLLSNQQYAVIATSAGKETLRERALATVRAAAAREGGKPDALEAIYFTSFVMQ
ncbi:MAG: hypothetical protein CMLOHMNK_00674 [Steroidobacteraceae bacterium]|nr:hypothetical protein [Steroidobacteraceae bacterium]